MIKWIKRIVALAVLAFLGLQFTNPARENPPVLPGHDALTGDAPPPAIAAMIKNSCYDCHSYETEWPWYSRVAPLSWFLVRDVNAARGVLNFSDWPHGDVKRERKRWGRIADDLESGDMPLPAYLRLHPKARLTETQRKQLIDWARGRAEGS